MHDRDQAQGLTVVPDIKSYGKSSKSSNQLPPSHIERRSTAKAVESGGRLEGSSRGSAAFKLILLPASPRTTTCTIYAGHAIIDMYTSVYTRSTQHSLRPCEVSTQNRIEIVPVSPLATSGNPVLTPPAAAGCKSGVRVMVSIWLWRT